VRASISALRLSAELSAHHALRRDIAAICDGSDESTAEFAAVQEE
jgi:hypothetical protein